MAMYRKVENCGPVPYPDRSGKFLKDGETAEGDDWEPLVALGFVVKVEGATPAAAAAPPPTAPVRVDPPKMEEPKAATLEEPKGVSDVLPGNDGVGTQEVDPSETGKSSDEGVSGRTPSRRRR